MIAEGSLRIITQNSQICKVARAEENPKISKLRIFSVSIDTNLIRNDSAIWIYK